MRKLNSVRVIALILINIFIWSPAVVAEGIKVQPKIAAESAILIDRRSGQVLWEKNSQERRRVASTTKIMTAILTLEKLGIHEKVVFSPNAAQVSWNEIKYNAGDERSAEELLYSLLLFSSNQSAEALAEKIAGSESEFVNMMNLKAAQLTAANTVFANPHGLPAAGPEYSTAKDMAIIAAEAMKHPLFRKIVASRDHEFTVTGRPARRIRNINKLLVTYPFAIGMKTGYTSKAGYCLVAAAKYGNLSLISVILGNKNRKQSFVDGKNILEFGFNNYAFRQIVSKKKIYAQKNIRGLFYKQVRLVADDDIYSLVYDKPTTIIYKTHVKPLKVPIKKGEILGKMVVSQFGQTIGVVNLLADNDVKKGTKALRKEKSFFGVFKLLLGILGF